MQTPNASAKAEFDQRYQTHLKHLKLKGLQPKSIEAYARAIRRMGEHFAYQIDNLTAAQLTDYFSCLVDTHSWSAVKHDLYGYKFYTQHVLGKPWNMPDFIKPPKTQRLPDILTVQQAQLVFAHTRILSYRVFYFTLYSMGLRLSEGLALRVGDIDADRQRVHIRDAKGNRDRLVPLPAITLDVLRHFWQTHRNPALLFPSRRGGLAGAHRATTPLNPAGVQQALHLVTRDCGLKKRLRRTACATAMPRT